MPAYISQTLHLHEDGVGDDAHPLIVEIFTPQDDHTPPATDHITVTVRSANQRRIASIRFEKNDSALQIHLWTPETIDDQPTYTAIIDDTSYTPS